MRNIFRERRAAVSLVIVFLMVPFAPSLMAQTTGTGALTGRVTDVSGAAVSNVTVTATSLDTGQVRNAITGTDGTYKFGLMPAGNYRVKFEAAGLKPVEIPTVTVTGTETAVLDGKLEAGEPSNGKSTPTPQDNLPNAPSSGIKEPSLEDLGFPTEQTQGDAKRQALLDKRTHMLKIHQRMGLITTIPLVAAIFSSPGAGGKSTSSTGRDLHLALGAVAGDLYGITAYYAIRAPRIPGTETRGPIRVHKALAWIHGPGMILTPILGAIAYDQKSKGERVHGIASAHLPVAIVTAGAFGAALLSVSVKF
jgi:Carboxypeptidase regulatory-like domain